MKLYLEYLHKRYRMFKEKIEDSRLTTDMQRTRSGRLQMFRKDYSDNKFISEENADVVLKHERPEMYAELIHDVWYWVNGCSKCEEAINYKENYSYQVCYEHNRCISCGTHRTDLTETPWGHQDGFICKPCVDTRDSEIRKQAFSKFREDKLSYYDFRNNATIKCPHCGSDNGDGSDNGLSDNEADLSCQVCEGEFTVNIEYQLSYTTSVIGEQLAE